MKLIHKYFFWVNSHEKTYNRKSLNKKMNSNKNRPILNIDDSEYYIDSLPDEGKGLVNGLRTADVQLKMYEDTLKMINIGKMKLLEDLKKIVEHIEPINK